jgi:pseudouridine-5'-phosphate glycosidase
MWPAADCGDCSSAGGAVPATIAVLGGVPHVGLTQQQLEHIAQRGLAVRCSSEQGPACLHSVMQAMALHDLPCTTPHHAAVAS